MALTPEQQAELKGLLQARQQEPVPGELQDAFDQRRRRAELGSLLERQTGRLPPPPPVQEAESLWQVLEAGWDQSVSGLAIQGESPDVVLKNDAPRLDRLLSMAATVVGDLPTFVAGGFVGSFAGGPIGSGAAAFGLTEGLRTWMLESYEQGHSRKSIAERLTSTLWAATKGAIVGGATAGAGKAAQGFMGKAAPSAIGPMQPRVTSAAGQFAGATAAELTTLVGVSHALEGELPSPDDFLDMAIVLGGFKGALHVSGKLREVYRRTGKTPKEVVKDAAKDSELWQEIVDPQAGKIPLQYEMFQEVPLRPGLPVDLAKKGATSPAGEAKDALRLADEMVDPLREILPPELRTKAHPNFELMAGDLGVKQALDALIARNKAALEEAPNIRRQGWKETAAKAEDFLRDTMGEEGMPRLKNPGTVEWAAEVAAYAEARHLTVTRARNIALELKEKSKAGEAPTAEDLKQFTDAVKMAETVIEAARGRSAEAGRALQIQKRAERLEGIEAREAEALKYIEEVGGKEAAQALGDILKKAPPKRKRTILGMVIEGWKSVSLLSGPATAQVNLLSNLSFAAVRLPKEVVAATLGKFKPGSAEHANYTDALALTTGMTMGAWRSLHGAGVALKYGFDKHGFARGLWESYKDIEVSRKGKQEIDPEIPGVGGELARAPFKALTLGDLLFRSINRDGTIYAEASRTALREGLAPLSKAYFQRVQHLVDNPDPKTVALAEADATRHVFMGGGYVVQSLKNLRKDIPALHFVIPFLEAPGGIFREFFRHGPAAPLVRQWREDFRAGGVKRDRAVAEALLGTAVAVPLFLMAQDGTITGGGPPDRRARRAWLNAGNQPYSVVAADGTQVTYDRYEPLGTLMGLSADLATAWRYLSEGERDDAAMALMWASTEIVKNKTWLRSLTSLLNAATNPKRYGEGWAESFTSSVVPNILGQTAREMDPYVREIDGILAAVQAKLPGLREDLPIMRDDFGEPIMRSEPLWPFSPSVMKKRSTDKVRMEAARLGVSTGGVPDKLHAGSVLGEGASVELSQPQREIFATESGRLAYELLSRRVNSPLWDSMHPLMQRQYYERVFAASRRRGAILALPPAERLQAIRALREENGL